MAKAIIMAFKKIISFISSVFKIPELKKLLNKNPTQLFFFFPTWELGGSERVHLQILEAVKDQNPTCFITFKPNNDGFKQKFLDLAYVIKLGFWGGHLRRLTIPIIAKHINRKKKPVVFGSTSTYFYDLIPHLKNHVKVIDLDHSFDKTKSDLTKTIQYYSRNVIQRIDTRIVLGEKGKRESLEFYKKLGVELKPDKFKVIPNAVRIPEKTKDFDQKKSQVLFVGRADKVKRVEIFDSIAFKVQNCNTELEFLAIGNFPAEFASLYPNIKFLGAIYDMEELYKLYSDSRYIILCSRTEGLPMVILEAMANAVIPISVNVGELESVITSNNGYLIDNSEDGGLIAEKMKEIILSLENNLNLAQQLSLQAKNDAINKYSEEIMMKSYRAIIS